MGQDIPGGDPLDLKTKGDETNKGDPFDLQSLLDSFKLPKPEEIEIETCGVEEIINYWKSNLMKVGDPMLMISRMVYKKGKIVEIDENERPRTFKLKDLRFYTLTEIFTNRSKSDLVPMKRMKFEELKEEQYPVVTYLPRIRGYFKAILKKVDDEFQVFTPNRKKGYPADPNEVYLNVSEYLQKKEEDFHEILSPQIPRDIVFEGNDLDEGDIIGEDPSEDKSDEEKRIMIRELIKKLELVDLTYSSSKEHHRKNQPVVTMHGSTTPFRYQKGKMIIKKDDEDCKDRYFVEFLDKVFTDKEPQLKTEELLEPRDLDLGFVYKYSPIQAEEKQPVKSSVEEEEQEQEGEEEEEEKPAKLEVSKKLRKGTKVIFNVDDEYFSEGIIFEDFPEKDECHCVSVMEGVERIVKKTNISLIPHDQLKKFKMSKKEVLQRHQFKKVLDTFESEDLILSKFAPYEDEDENEPSSPLSPIIKKEFKALSWYSPKIKLYKQNPYDTLTKECERMKCKFNDPYFPVEDRFVLCSKYTHNSLRYQKCCAKRAFLWWKRVCKFENKSYDFNFFTEGHCDFNQSGSLGNCSFLAFFPYIDTNEKMQNLVFPPHANPNGFYVFKIYNAKKDEHNYLVIDDYIPLKGRFILHCSSIKNTFFSLLEKATAKIWGSYANTEGELSTLFPDRTHCISSLFFECSGKDSDEVSGSSCSWKDFLMGMNFRTNEAWRKWKEKRAGDFKFYEEKKKEAERCDQETKERIIFDALREHREVFYDMLMLTGGNGKNGIAENHAYTLYSVHEFCGLEEEEEEEKTGERKDNVLRLVFLRNPGGLAPWDGDWSKKSGLWEEYPEVKEKLFGKVKCGWFFMSITDLMKYFTAVRIYPSKIRKSSDVE